MGNVIEDWMTKITPIENSNTKIDSGFKQHKRANALLFLLKNKLFTKVLGNEFISRLFYKYKKLPMEIIDDFSTIAPTLK